MKKLLVAGVVAVVGALLWNAAPASAHHPEVAVEVCPGPENLQNAVDVTAYAFEVPADWSVDHRINTNIRVDVTGPGVDLTATGQFVAPDYSFTTRFDIPEAAGKTLTVRVTALDLWGSPPQYPSTQDWAETTITVPVCNETAPTSTTAAPTSTAAPTTTAAPTSTAAPTTTVPTEVGGITEVRPQIPGGTGTGGTGGTGTGTGAGGQAAQLAFSGVETGPTLLAGAGLLAIGASLLLSTRRRRGTV